MKKISIRNLKYFIAIMCSLLILSVSAFIANDIFNVVTALIFTFASASIIFIFCCQLILKFSSSNYIFSKIKVYVFLILFFIEYFLVNYEFIFVQNFCELSYSWDLKCKFIILVIIVCLISLGIICIIIVKKNNKKVEKHVICNDEFEKVTKGNVKVKEKLDYYFKNKKIDGAILINGTWGSGKTYFIEKYVDLFNSNNEERAVYVSLNGLKNIDEVNNALFAALHPILSTIKDSPILKVLSCAVKYTSDILSINYDSLSEINFDISRFDASLIVFDDVERCQVEIPVLFGYFDLIKKSCRKIVLVADEKELINYLFPEEAFHNKVVSSNVLIANKYCNIDKSSSKQEENEYNNISEELQEIEKNLYPKKYYEVIKEKVVWDTINFNFDINIVFDIIVNYKEYENIKSLVENNKSLIKELEVKVECCNLRTYKCALDFLSDLYSKIDFSSFRIREETEKILILNVFALMISYKHPLKFRFETSIRIGKKDYKKMFSFSKYNNNLYVDINELKNELASIEEELVNIEKNIVPTYIMSLKETWVYKSDEEITNSINEMLNDYKSNKLEKKYYISCYNYLYTYKEEFGFELNDVDLCKVKEELIKRISSSNEYIELDDFFYMRHSFYEKEINDIKEIYQALEIMNQKNKSKNIVGESLNVSNLSFDRIQKISEQALGRKAFLSLFILDDLVNVIKVADNEEIMNFRTLIHRVYGFSNITDYFESDKEIIELFIKELEKYKENCASKTKKKLLEWFIRDLNDILGRL